MKQWKRKILSILISVVMILGVMPATGVAVLADDATPTEIASVDITVTPPAAGTTNVDAQSIVTIPAGKNYSLKSAYWVLGDSSSPIVTQYTNIEAGSPYALAITLKAEEGYAFQEGDTYSVTGATPNDAGVLWLYDSSEANANVLVMPTEAASTVNMHVWTPGHGKVLIDGSDYGTEFQGTWEEGTNVSIEAVPDSGYKFARWWIKPISGSGRLVQTASTTMVAGTDAEAEARFGLETAPVTIAAPAAGTSGVGNLPAITVPSEAGYSVKSTMWVGESSTLDALSLETPTNFEAGKTYYAYVTVEDGADAFAATGGGAAFDTSLDVSSGTLKVSRNWQTSDGVRIEAIIAVTIPAATSHTVTFNTQGGTPVPTTQTVNDGAYATKPAHPSKNGFYFLGWFEKPGAELTREEVHSGGFKFADTAITEDKTLYAVWYQGFYGATYDLSAATPKYAETGGDAIFTSTYQQMSYAGKVWWDYSIVEGSEVTVTATPAEGARFVGWAPGTLNSDNNMPDDPAELGAIVSTKNPYTFTFNGRTALAALFEKEAPSYELSFAFTNLYPGAQPQTLVESLTVNGEDWTPASGNITAKDIPAGSSVTATVKVTDDASIASYNNPDKTIADLAPTYSDDNSEVTFAFTMPETDARIVVYLFETVTITYDANGGAKQPAWTDSVKQMKYTAGTSATINVSQELYDMKSGEPRVLPAEGYEFDGIEVTQNKTGAKVTGKPGQTITVDISEGGTIKYLWKKKDVTVTFDAKDGTPEPAAQTFTAGGKATKPADPTKTGWEQAPGSLGGGFDGWYTDENYTNKFDFDTEVTDDITLYARWNGQIEVRTHDKTSGQNLVGGTFSCENVEESVTGMYSHGSSWIAEGTPVTLTATPATGYRFVGWAKDSATGEIVSTDATYEFTFTENPTTLYAVFEEIPPVLTLHASSVEGDDFVDSIVIEAPKKSDRNFMTIAEALEQYKSGTSLATELFQVDGYEDYGYRTPKPMSEYSSYDDLWNNSVDGSAYVDDNMDLYYSMAKLIDAVEVTYTPPVCGTETTTPSEEHFWGTSWIWDQQTKPPATSLPGDANYEFDKTGGGTDWSFWIADMENRGAYVGTFEGGKQYLVETWLAAKYGYTFSEDVVATVNGGTLVSTDYDGGYVGVYANVTAEHDWSEWAQTKAPTCTVPGVETRECKCNDEDWHTEAATETREIKALGHSWGAWKQTKAATCTAAGTEQRVCAHDSSHKETRAIKALGHSWSAWKQTKAATCTAAGTEQRVCAHDASHKQTRSLKALGHKYGKARVTKKASFQAAGVKTRTCENDKKHTTTQAIPKLTVTNPVDKTYTGKAQTQNLTVKSGSTVLKKDKDYTVTYKNNVNVGTATVTIKAKGSLYEGSISKTFKIKAPAVTTPHVAYMGHLKNTGWEKSAAMDGKTAGTTGQSRRMEAMILHIDGGGLSGTVQYRSHLQNTGWEKSWKSAGAISGTTGQSRRMEAVQIRLTGELAKHYDIYYRVHVKDTGWMGWAKNGDPAGTTGESRRMEAIQIRLVKKGAAAPGSTKNAFRKK